MRSSPVLAISTSRPAPPKAKSPSANRGSRLGVVVQPAVGVEVVVELEVVVAEAAEQPVAVGAADEPVVADVAEDPVAAVVGLDQLAVHQHQAPVLSSTQ